jgi:acetyl-CoA C-acetyltransferase
VKDLQIRSSTTRWASQPKTSLRDGTSRVNSRIVFLSKVNVVLQPQKAEGVFTEELTPVNVPGRKGITVFLGDEHARADTTLEGLAKLRPAFKADGGTVTAGNSSGLNDGVAMLAVTTEDYAREHGLPILARILSYATVGVDPELMGIGPASAVPAALSRAGLSLSDIDLFG